MIRRACDALRAAGQTLGVVLSPRREWARRACDATLLPTTDPHADSPDPFRPLTTPDVARAWDRIVRTAAPAVLNATGARPWDDPIWWSLLDSAEAPAAPVILILTARFEARARARGVPIFEPAPQSSVPAADATLARAAQRVLDAPDRPLDDDEPLLRRLALEARQDGEHLVARLLRLGQYLLLHGTSAAARGALEEAATLASVAAATDTRRLHDLAAVLDALGDSAAALDDVEAAARRYRESAHATAAFRRAHPNEEQARWGTAVSALRLAQAARAAGEYDAATSEVRAALAAVVADAGSDDEQRLLTLAPVVEADILHGDLTGAAERLRGALPSARALLASTPRRFDRRALVLSLVRASASSLLALGDLSAAEQALTEAAGLCVDLAGRAPSRWDFASAVASTTVLLADLRLATGEDQLASGALERAAALYDRLLARDPERVAARCERARVQRRHAYLGADPGDQLARAEATWAARPTDPARRHDLALAWSTVAWVAERDTHVAEAHTAWRAAAYHAEGAWAAAPAVPAFRRTALRCADGAERTGRPERG